ncbi:MAG: YdcF family protein [Erysipelotrichaceae bacterium]|nr:YdcF family protein [Erysipelotrichaceae bacterium]
MKIRFDTRERKPSVFFLLIPVIIAAVILIVLSFLRPERHAVYAGTVLSLLFLSLSAGLLIAFVRQLEYNLYSYNTIYYMGFALFSFAVFLTYVLLTWNIARYSEVYRIAELFHLIRGSAINYMFLSFPFLLIFSIALCVSNISLIAHEGRSFVNILGIILSFLLVGGFLLLFWYDYAASGSWLDVMIHDIVGNTFAAIYLYFECMLVGVIVADAIAAKHEPDPDKDFMIVLGCGLRKDGTPTPLLRGRIERAMEFAEKQERLTGKKLTFVTSGGQGPDEAVSESASMKRYLLEHGIPEDRILEEDRSTSTMENMRFSKEKIIAADPQGKVAFSTTNYHVFRSGLFARRVKMKAVGIGAKTKWYFWPNAAVREFVGLLTEHRGKQALILGSMIVFYVTVTIIAYTV